MAVSQAYGKVEIPMIGEDEPVFILRAQDILATSAIQMYRLLAEAHGCQVAEALGREIKGFMQWPGIRKLPAWPIRDEAARKGRDDAVSKGRRPSG